MRWTQRRQVSCLEKVRSLVGAWCICFTYYRALRLYLVFLSAHISEEKTCTLAVKGRIVVMQMESP